MLSAVLIISTDTAVVGAQRATIAPAAEVDLGVFSARAQAWNHARRTHRLEALELVGTLADDTRAAEAERLIAEEAARVARADAHAEADRLAAEQAAAEAAAALTTTTTTTTTARAADESGPAPESDGVTGGPTEAAWEALRQCESSGNYSALSFGGRYRGAYQFSQATWDWVAGFVDSALIGVDPAAAAPADQDRLALKLWQLRGWSPWPVCGAGLG